MEGNNWQNSGMGGMAMGKCEDWQREFFYNETKCKHFQGWYGGLQFGNVYTCNGFFQKTCIERFVNRRLTKTWEFSIHIIYESSTMTLCNSR